ncbi:aminopeptidase [Candidatus Parabeggiatoa sp. HSG14]|uniref:aminopeptidase n=1 Tax=Candidatus Parabeggiatoa sp. HSG14 TaxID=3055593 RepID=UPI0025A6E488|nr:aminopeptidase [Thiotrichales bacterium HSG14]
MKKNRFLILCFFLTLCLSLLNGCSNVAYYSQAIGGQWDIFKRSQPIDSILTNEMTPTLLKQQLTNVLKIRAFASEVLHLPENQSYTYYADLERPFVVWSVFATPAFSFEPKQWCFVVVGCMSYRGYFSEADAQQLATKLRAQNYDVYVAGVPAYSTLGWFDDPVLNTMLRWSQTQIAGLIFHELAHQKLYISDDTAFNEAFATAVEYIGIERWLTRYGTSHDIAEYQQSQQRQAEFIELVLTTRNHLQHIYQQNESPKQKQAAKILAFDTLRTHYTELKKRWNGYAGYDHWFSQDLNNAKLLSVVTYQDLVPAFQILLSQQDGDLLAFYKKIEQLGKLPIEQRHKILMKDVK